MPYHACKWITSGLCLIFSSPEGDGHRLGITFVCGSTSCTFVPDLHESHVCRTTHANGSHPRACDVYSLLLKGVHYTLTHMSRMSGLCLISSSSEGDGHRLFITFVCGSTCVSACYRACVLYSLLLKGMGIGFSSPLFVEARVTRLLITYMNRMFARAPYHAFHPLCLWKNDFHVCSSHT